MSTDTNDLRSCDSCSAEVPRDKIAVVIAYGIETGACEVCRGGSPEAVERGCICPVIDNAHGKVDAVA